MKKLLRTDSSNPDFQLLVKALDADLATRDGKDAVFYAQFNKIDMIKNALLIYEDEQPVACGAMKAFEEGSMEVKRMYTVPAFRGRGMASSVIAELEKWARELGIPTLVLETGKNQPEAISLYTKLGYQVIPNYGQYIGIENSICFRKKL